VSSSLYVGLLIIFADQFPLDASSVEAVLAISKTSDFPSDKICGEFSRILKPGGTVSVCKVLEGETGEIQQTIQRRVTLAGFLEPQCLDLKSIKLSTFSLSFGVSTFTRPVYLLFLLV